MAGEILANNSVLAKGWINDELHTLTTILTDDHNESWTEGNGVTGGNFSTVSSTAAAPAVVLVESWWWSNVYLLHSTGWTVTLIVAYAIILVIGVIGNFMVILVIFRRPQMRSVTNMFITNLAVADLFVIVFCVPATLISNIFAPWVLGRVMCKGVAYVQGLSVCASAYSLVVISIDRCKAIYLSRGGITKSQAHYTIFLIWTAGVLLTIPWAVTFEVITSEQDGLTYCVETWTNEAYGKVYYLVVNLISFYAIPFVLIAVSNLLIWIHVIHRKVPQDSEASADSMQKLHQETRHEVLKMLVVVTLAFLLSWLPLNIILTRRKFAGNMGPFEKNLWEVLMPVAQWLGSWNSSINPVLYSFLNSKFREMFKSLLPAWLPFVNRKASNMRIINKNGYIYKVAAGRRGSGPPFCGHRNRGSIVFSTTFRYSDSIITSLVSVAAPPERPVVSSFSTLPTSFKT